MIHIGIDPGAKGAIVIREEDGTLSKFIMPHKPKEGYNDVELAKMFRYIASMPGEKRAVLEKVHAIHGSSAKATFTFGGGFKTLCYALVRDNIPFTLVPPKVWQKTMHAGVFGKEAKVKSLNAARQLFPSFDLRATERSKIAHEGVVDALLMAEYSFRMYNR